MYRTVVIMVADQQEVWFVWVTVLHILLYRLVSI